MPEHVHLLVWPRDPNYQTSRILASIKKPVGYRAIQYLKQHAPDFLERLTIRHRNRVARHFWQVGPGHDLNVTDPRAAHQVLEYIHANPVRRGLVHSPEDWLWSSAADWAGRAVAFLRVDRTLPMLVEPAG
jgi:putative transposase